MRVFLSWSGEKSHEVALALKDWLPEVVNNLDPWVSSEDIEKGANWGATIALELEQSNFGIICLTRENQGSVWLNYEAGAIAKKMAGTTARAATFLIDFESDSEVTGPLFQFQSTKPTRDEVLKLVKTLNKAAGSPRGPEQLKRSVDMWWPELERAIVHANRAELASSVERRSERDVLDEVLIHVRDIARDVGRSTYGRSVELGYRGAWRGASSSGLQERLVLSTKDAMVRDLNGIGEITGIPIDYHFQIDSSGAIELTLHGEYSDEVFNAVSTAAAQRGIPVSVRQGIVATATRRASLDQAGGAHDDEQGEAAGSI